jgi:hypothetical protein
MKNGRNVTVIASILLWGCVDTSPVAYTPPEPKDAQAVDGSGDAGLGLACRQCITGDGAPCRPSYDVCVGIDKCELIMTCLFDKNCMTFTVVADRINCGLPCLSKYGVLAGIDKATTALADINVCTIDSCKTECSGR